MVDLLIGLLQALLTLGVVALVIGVIAVMFIVIFMLANTLDKNVNQ
jgi:hypothetical protein